MSGSRLLTLWGTSETPLPRSAAKPAASCSSPSNQMRPRTVAFGSNRPSTASARSVLPDPDAPTTATISPSWTEMLRSWITCTVWRDALKKGSSSRYMVKPTERSSTCSRWWPWLVVGRGRRGCGGGAPRRSRGGSTRGAPRWACRTARRPVAMGVGRAPRLRPAPVPAASGFAGFPRRALLGVSHGVARLPIPASCGGRRGVRRLEPATSNREDGGDEGEAGEHGEPPHAGREVGHRLR